MKKEDIDSLSIEDFEKLQKTLNKKIRAKIEKTLKDINNILNDYDLEMFLAVKIIKKDNSNLSKEEVFN